MKERWLEVMIQVVRRGKMNAMKREKEATEMVTMRRRFWWILGMAFQRVARDWRVAAARWVREGAGDAGSLADRVEGAGGRASRGMSCWSRERGADWVVGEEWRRGWMLRW